MRIVVVGSAKENYSPYLLPNIVTMRGEHIHDVAAVLAECDLCIANESGIALLSDLVGTKTLTIVGQIEPSRIRPINGDVITTGIHCQPCLKYPFGPMKYGKCNDECLIGLLSLTVWEKVKGMLNEEK